MNLKNFKPNIPVQLESWGGMHHVFELGARCVADIVALPEGVLVRLERDTEGMAKSATVLITGPGSGELAPLQDTEDDDAEH